MEHTVGGDVVVTGWTVGSNGLIKYDKTSGPGLESPHEKAVRERFWRSMGKKIRKVSFIK